MDLDLPAAADPQREFSFVWIDYWDEARTGQRRDTWRMGTEPPHRSSLVLAESQLVT